MSPHTALRLAVRPLRSAILPLNPLRSRSGHSLSQQLSRPRSSQPSFSACLPCTVRAQYRVFSSLPPSNPPNNNNNETSDPSQPPQPSSSPQDDPSTATTSTNEDAHPTDPKPNPEDEPSTSPSPPPPPPPPPSSPETAGQSPPSPPPPLDEGPELPSSSEDRRHPLSARFSTWMDDLQSRALNATQTINDLTGYSAIEAIKARNSRLESDLAAAQARLRQARHDYKSLTSHRAATQREVTALLARKDTWNPADLERFTSLYRLDHELEAQVASASVELTEAETDESKLSGDLNAGILKRYHEEQIWSDRIRRQSTWGTWGLMGVNILLFLVLQFGAEPWRRKRLMRNIAENEKLVMDDVKRELQEVREALERSGLREMVRRREEEEEKAAIEATAMAEAAAVEAGGETVAPPVEVVVEEAVVEEEPKEEDIPWQDKWKVILSDPELLKAAVLDLYSERRIDLSMRDASLIALEGAAAGAAVVAALALLLLRGGNS